MKKITALFFVLASAASANTILLIANGSFTTGDFTAWTVTTNDTPGNGNWFVTSASSTPLNGFPTVGPDSSTYYAVSDAYEPGSRALTQSFTVPLNATDVAVSGDIFVNDWFGDSGLGGEVDILAAGANPLTATPIVVAYGPVDTSVSNGAPNGWVPFSFDITSSLTPGASYQLRILESDASGPINVGADNLSVLATTASTGVPEPSSAIALSLLCGFLIHRMRKAVA
jgi:hypothetical protein